MTEQSAAFFNPARQLHNLITDFLDGLNAEKTTAEKRWRHILDLDDAELGTLLLAYSEVVRLPDKTRTLLTALPEHPDHLARQLAPLPKFEDLFRSTSLQGNCTPYKSQISGEVLARLDTAAMAIERHHGHAEPRGREKEQAAEEVREKLEGIRADVAADPGLESNVRAYLLRHLSAMSEALALYVVDGIAPVIDVLDMMAGHDTRDPETAKQARSTPHWRNIQEVVRTFNAMLQIAARLGLPFGALPAIEAPAPPAIEQPADITPHQGEPQPDTGAET